MSRNVKVTMPYDTRSPNPNGGRPQMPTLSAGAARGMNKPTIAPKLATKASAPTLAANAHTPLAKRIQRPATANLSTPVPLRGTSQLEDDPNGLLGLNNITPRSGKRQSRVDSASSTPNGTPIPDRHEGWDRDSSVAGAASPVGYESNTTAMPALTFSPMSSDLQLQPKPETLNDLDSKFFHASDVRSTQQTAPGPAPIKPTLARAPTFFYAVRNKIDSKPNTPASVTSVPLQKPSQDNLAGKFVYANGTPDLKPSPPTSATSRPSSVLSMASRAPTSRPLSSSQTSAQSAAQRPVSPVKLAQQPHVSFQRNEKKPSLVTNRTHANLPPQLGPPPALRRTSTGTSLSRGGHSRQSSLTIGEVELKTGFIPSGPSSPLPLASPHHQPLTFASILQAADDFGEDESVTSADNSRSEIQSPTRFSHPVEPLSDLVANARRERKVQDLQITNASLEAINRTLERQLRKQTAELRRYKRLSRAGRLSMVSSVVPSRVVSESHSTGGDIEGLALSDLDEEDSSEEFEEDDSFSDTDSASESLSPSLMAERDAKHRKKDEKRLQLDLSKHQELLIDSQKINQSIKRCMDWTEELIKEGKKALEYSVRVSDVEIPRPRVLAPRDEEEDQTQNSINFDPDAAFEEISNMIVDKEETDAGRVMPLEPRLAGWQPASMDVNGGGETLGDSP